MVAANSLLLFLLTTGLTPDSEQPTTPIPWRSISETDQPPVNEDSQFEAEVQQPLTTVSSNSNPTIMMLQAKSEFVSKNNVVPFHCPCMPFIALLAVQTSMVFRQGSLGLETKDTMYPETDWRHIDTDGNILKDSGSAVAGPRRKTFAEFHLSTGDDCLLKHLYRILVTLASFCTDCDTGDDMDADLNHHCA
ncbi:hypothetical protein TNCV_3764491 [Trichonephila clavipes]|uniref:Uncharacterized protein n=1 Tax=Trichonephila clavipes TaxID=2585209 RepID=A0A8X7B9P3_TRICX|nr:hypothetical protein TNCV_3764491 [Trichonephila clavipes]